MLPQFLVQNDLISNPSKTDFNLDWFLAAPIVNLNFFHIEKLLEEQAHYRQLLRPWTPTEEGITVNNYSVLKKHEYGYAAQPIPPLNPLKIYAGTLVGRINKTNNNPSSDFVAITQTLTNDYIEYDTINHCWYWQENRDPAYPAIIRPNYAHLKTSQFYKLDSKSFTLNNGWWSYTTFQDNYKWQMNLQWQDGELRHPVLMRNTDIIFGRIIIKDGSKDCCIANVPITLDIQWNPNTCLFTYTFSFRDQNFPSNATVELY